MVPEFEEAGLERFVQLREFDHDAEMLADLFAHYGMPNIEWVVSKGAVVTHCYWIAFHEDSIRWHHSSNGYRSEADAPELSQAPAYIRLEMAEQGVLRALLAKGLEWLSGSLDVAAGAVEL